MSNKDIKDKIMKVIDEYEFKILNDIEKIKINADYIHYICPCSIEHKKTIKEFFKKPLKSCCDERILIEKFNNEPEEKEENDQIWRKYENVWISNKGSCLSLYGKEMIKDEKGRLYINKKHQYTSRVMAVAFNLENSDKLDSQSYIVTFLDGDNNNFDLDNLKVITKSEMNSKNGENSKKSIKFQQTMLKSLSDYLGKPHKILKELPNHIIFEDGSIYNDSFGKNCKRFMTGSLTPDGYLNLCTKDKTYKMHRLICMAFKPIEGKDFYDDYKGYEVNHIDGNKINNEINNLEWVNHSKNMSHAYETNLNKKKRAVLQFENLNGKYGKLIKEYVSIIDASRETLQPDFQIREICKGKYKSLESMKFLWKYKNEEETEIYRQKFSSKLADRN